MRASFLFLGILFLLVFLAACEDNSSPTVMQFSGPTMGTTYNITLIDPPPQLAQITLQKQIDQRLQLINQQMSTYIDDSEISQFNSSELNQWYSLSAEFFEVVALSQHISVLSEGYFDITIGPLIDVWGFGKHFGNTVPSEDLITEARSKVGYQYLAVDESRQAIKKSIPLRLNVSAIAKGYGVDQLVELLAEQGVNNYLVEIGGELRVKGLNRQGHKWRVGIEEPALLQQQAKRVVALDNHSVATSGDYRNYFEDNGQRYSHTIDPNTGRPVRHNIASVTVIAETAAEADGMATALNVLGAEKALALAESQNLAAYFIFYDNSQAEPGYRSVYSKAFEPFLKSDTQ